MLAFIPNIVYVFIMISAKQNNTKSGRPVGTGTTSRPLTDKEVKRLLGVCYGVYGLRNRAIIMLGLSGCRVGTVMRLSYKDLVEPTGKIKGSFVLDGSREKSKRTHRYYVSKQARKMIQDYIEHSNLDVEGPLFPSPKTGGFMGSSAGSRLISNLLQKAEIYDNSSHCLRKTMAHKCYVDHSMGLLELQAVLNHATPQQTLKYVGNLTPNISRVIESISF